MSTHTPGPWDVEPISDDWDGPINVVSKLTLTSGGLRSANWIAECNIEDDLQENHANARLIAAAPELLASLKEMEEMLHLWMQENTGPRELDTLERCERALAKAEGR